MQEQTPPTRGFARLVERTEWLRRHDAAGYGIALAAVVIATLLRWALTSQFPDGFPYLTFFPAVVLTTFFCGLRPGVLSAVLSGFAAWYFFIPPFHTFELDLGAGLTLAFFSFVVAVDIALIHHMHEATRRLRDERSVVASLHDEHRVMFQELQHRVANNMQFIAGLLAMERRRASEDPQAALASLDRARARLETISRIHRQLYDPDRVNMPIGPYLQDLCADVLEATGARNIVCLVDVPPIQLDLTRLTALSLFVVEIVTNALKHAFEPEGPGAITVRLERLDFASVALTISDNGKGMPARVDPERSQRLGSRIVKNLAAQLQGRLTYANLAGTQVRLEFPIGRS